MRFSAVARSRKAVAFSLRSRSRVQRRQRHLMATAPCGTCRLMNCTMLRALLVAVLFLPAGPLGCSREEQFACERGTPWNDFWCAHHVAPAPPVDFLEGAVLPPQVVNGTNGELSDEAVRDWLRADLRRGRGESWAFEHLRADIIESDVLGPPGLNGTGEALQQRKLHGVVAVSCPTSPRVVELVAAGVFAVPQADRDREPEAHLTKFILVLVRRSTGRTCTLSFANGHTEQSQTTPVGTLSWQLDTGEVHDDAAVGPIWYQANGWSCMPDGATIADSYCARVQP